MSETAIPAAGPATGVPETLLNEVQAARVLNVSVRTLQAWRLRGGGPRYVKCGRAVRYRRGDLGAWIEANTVSHSTEADMLSTRDAPARSR